VRIAPCCRRARETSRWRKVKACRKCAEGDPAAFQVRNCFLDTFDEWPMSGCGVARAIVAHHQPRWRSGVSTIRSERAAHRAGHSRARGRQLKMTAAVFAVEAHETRTRRAVFGTCRADLAEYGSSMCSDPHGRTKDSASWRWSAAAATYGSARRPGGRALRALDCKRDIQYNGRRYGEHLKKISTPVSCASALRWN